MFPYNDFTKHYECNIMLQSEGLYLPKVTAQKPRQCNTMLHWEEEKQVGYAIWLYYFSLIFEGKTAANLQPDFTVNVTLCYIRKAIQLTGSQVHTDNQRNQYTYFCCCIFSLFR